MTRTGTITTEAALDAGARLLADLIGGLAKTPEGRAEMRAGLVAGIAQAQDVAEAEVLRRAVEMLRDRR